MAASLERPLVVIVGQTASGKSDLAMRVAEAYDGEIICADSRTIYKGMDIGTAKPSKEDQIHVPHHLLDIVTPEQSYSAAQFKADANTKIAEILSRGKLPIMVGGTGLYVDAVLYNYQFRPVDVGKRQRLAGLSLSALQAQAHKLGIAEDQIDFKNKRHLLRAVETENVLHDTQQLRPNTLLIGLNLDREILRQRIAKRVQVMLDNGLVAEVTALGERYGWNNEALSGICYRLFGQYIRREVTLDEAVSKFVQGDMNLAKRQRTWFKRNPHIQWFDDPKQAFGFLTKQLQ